MSTINELNSTDVLQHLSFKLKKETFAFEISQVREVLDFTEVTKIPGTPPFMRGVLNLRGNVVPVIDLQLKFGMGRTEKSTNTCVIIVEVTVEGEVTQVGALADSVQEVLDLDSKEIEPPPKIGMNMESKFIMGMGKHNDEFIIILNIAKIFSMEEISMVQEMKHARFNQQSEIDNATLPADITAKIMPELNTVSEATLAL